MHNKQAGIWSWEINSVYGVCGIEGRLGGLCLGGGYDIDTPLWVGSLGALHC